MKRYLLRSLPLRSQRIRSLIVRWAHELHCALIVIPTGWPPRIVAEGWENWHILYLPHCIQPARLAWQRDHDQWLHDGISWHLMMWLQVCRVFASLLLSRAGDDQGLEVTVLVWILAWQLLMCSAYGATHAMGNVLNEAKILLIVLKSRSFKYKPANFDLFMEQNMKGEIECMVPNPDMWIQFHHLSPVIWRL